MDTLGPLLEYPQRRCRSRARMRWRSGASIEIVGFNGIVAGYSIRRCSRITATAKSMQDCLVVKRSFRRAHPRSPCLLTRHSFDQTSTQIAADPRRLHLVLHVWVSLTIYRFQCSKIPSLRLLAADFSSSLLRLSSLNPSFTKNLTTTTTSRLSNMLEPQSLMMDLESELFNYTAGRFLANDARHLQERRRVFNIPGLFNTIAKAMNCETAQIVDFRKLAEGGFNRIFLITLDTEFQLVARIPYLLLVPKAYAVASEVAIMDFFRSKYQSTNIDEDAESVLVAGAEKELAYLNQFGASRVPYECFWREYYNYEKQLPLDHIENLGRYLRLAPSLVPDDDSLSAFCIRHPDLTDSNLRVSTDSGCLQILSVLDWQHAAILPLFLHAGMPRFIQNEEDEVSQKMVKPELPDGFDKLPAREGAPLSSSCSLSLQPSTATHNRIHHKGFVHPLNPFRCRIFIHATDMWEGETIKLLYALIDLVRGWGHFATDGTMCPVVFTEKVIAAAEELWQALANAERGERWLRDFVAYGEETWVPAAHYEAAKAIGQEVKRRTFKACAEDEEMTKETYAVIEAN
ncbi:hypothetical protein GGU11DRAFT_818342 [Lentinula aff. detonsa]|nr:hypothetical protein GGU11DRAFT_818342 [Lentinula aff. detonsa]